MEYTVQKLAQLSGVSARTIRYYDELELLKPYRISSSGYRIYGAAQVDRLQQILFYRELDLPLEAIRDILAKPDFNAERALKSHRDQLVEKRARIDALIITLNRTIANTEGSMTMTDAEKFAGFKQKLIDSNEDQYGNEIRERYGDDTINKANQKLMGMTEEDYEAFNKLTDTLMATLAEAAAAHDPNSEIAQRAAALHKEWLMFYWPEYSAEAHAGLAQMYVDDPRFRAHYDVLGPGTAEFLRDAIRVFTGRRD